MKLRYVLLLPFCLAEAFCAEGRGGSRAFPAGAPDPLLPPVQLFVPGFEVRELPVGLTNQNNVAYAPDGRLFTAGYDGRVHQLRDTDGDGREDHATPLWDRTSDDYALGIAFQDGCLFVLFRTEIARFRDADGDGILETREIAASNWDDPALATSKLFSHRRVDYALGLAIGPDGSFYVSMGNAAPTRPYLMNADGQSQYNAKVRRGCVLRIKPDGTVEQLASGVRYLMSLQFNRHGDLFATEQEGATWVPNGNPFDELLHIQANRHYGFPPRHPRYLPEVIDEPSVFDYAPQHQSTCGFRFNESLPGGTDFGPSWWQGDALVTGESRGHLYRTKLARGSAGYVAQNQLVAVMQALPVDCALSPHGDLVVAAHSGLPDWGSGPQGIGRLFKLSYSGREVPQPVLIYPVSATETVIEFDRPSPAMPWQNLPGRAALQGGLHLRPGEHYERIRPGYAVVQAQRAQPRQPLTVLGAGLSADGRTLTVRSAPRTESVSYALSVPGPTSAAKTANLLPQDELLALGFDLTGAAAEWRPAAAGIDSWSGWLPHLDLRVARELTAPSAAHARLFERLSQPGTLRLRAQLDLWQMLRAATQPGSNLGFEHAPETVTLVFAGSQALKLSTTGAAKIEQVDTRSCRLTLIDPQEHAWQPIELTLETAAGIAPALEIHWFTQEDPRPRALPLRRTLTPWAQPPGVLVGRAIAPELAGANWENGRKLYFGAAACFACHGIRGEGKPVGPDLGNLIHRDYASVLKDITQPNATLNPDYLSYVIALADGGSRTGIITGDTTVQVKLTDATGATESLPRSRIRSIQPLPVSLMPEGLLQSLAPTEVRDLMAFLLTERPSP